MVATQAGSIVAAHAQDRQDLDAELRSQLDELKGLARGEVTVAAGEGFVAELWRLVLDEFLERHPRIQVQVRTGGTDHLTELVGSDLADLAIVLHPRPDPHLHAVRSKDEPLRVVCSPNHPLARRQSLTPADLQGREFAVMPERFGLRTLHDQLLRAYDVAVATRLETESQPLLVDAIRSGRVLGLLPEIAIARHLAAGELIALPLRDPQVTRVQARLLVRQGRRLLPAATALVQAVAAGMFGDDSPPTC